MKLYAIKVRRDANTTTPTDIPEHELPILQEIFGEENVQTSDGRSIEDFGLGEPSGEVADPEDEFSRLSFKYGVEMIEAVYGKKASKGLESAIAASKAAADKADADAAKAAAKAAADKADADAAKAAAKADKPATK